MKERIKGKFKCLVEVNGQCHLLTWGWAGEGLGG